MATYIFNKVKEVVDKEAKRFECISKRYGLPFCILFIWSDIGEEVGTIVKANTRCADLVAKVDENLHLLLFFANRPDSYSKVANKLMYVLEKSFPKGKFYIGVACIENTDMNIDLNSVITRALQNLLTAKESQSNTIEDTF